MGILTIIGIAVGLSMDCLAVAMACGVRLKKPSLGQTMKLSAGFGGAQALMPVLGWLAGRSVVAIIQGYDHWLAFALLVFVGGKMIWEYFSDEDETGECAGDPTTGREFYLLTIATSIDALAVGLSLAFVNTGIVLPAAIIGVVCFSITAAGVYLGVRASEVWGRRMELVGGLVLIGIGIKVLLEHLGK